MTVEKKKSNPNALIGETSPYLLQHAYNPVDWKPWNEDVLEEAKRIGKPILVSVGYSACHWCHVMEHESFEDEEVAALMNSNFVCIKVDREERPDVDQLYMNAAQLITGRGGWPLNCFAFPDGRPFYAGTYFPKENWMKLLQTIDHEFRTNKPKLEDYAQKLLAGIQQTSEIKYTAGFSSSNENLLKQVDASVLQWSQRFDHENGGNEGAPKFPIPNNLLFLMRYAHHFENQPVMSFVDLSLTKMARGGIYDQIGGGFARYTVDNAWKIPHFEKMLYDNALLLEVYAQAYKRNQNPEYYQVINETCRFVNNELTAPGNGFYSAYDADSEGVEGRFYVWQKKELQDLLGDDFDAFSSYYNVNEKGHWEEGNYILLRSEPGETMLKYGLDVVQLEQHVSQWKSKLYQQRQNRVPPGLDDKVLTSWNAMMISGLTTTYNATQNERFLAMALNAGEFIVDHQMNDDHSLWHSHKQGVSTISGFLEDYAWTARAFLDLYTATSNVVWARIAKQLCDYTLSHFYVEDTGFFNFTPHASADLVVKNVDYFDSVVPSSNSTMCRNLVQLSRLFLEASYGHKASEMIAKIGPKLASYGSGFSNWMLAVLDDCHVVNEVVIVGEESHTLRNELNSMYLPGSLVMASKTGDELPVFEHRYQKGKTLIYVCQNNTCQAPVESLAEALKHMQ
ncbi:MAG: thioredoxin domain-containing protein [Bacteroidia bacterium]|nr:thioredoxin domain-containing protein [Bacteroidia bacterium]